VVVIAIIAVVAWSERVPAPLPHHAPPDAFSASRAWPALAYLADTIGSRVTGTPGADRAAAYVAARLRALPGLEVEVQDVTGFIPTPHGALAYRTRNVVARLPGGSANAVLVSSHYDSPEESVGAADAALPVSVMIEMAHALAASPRLANTVILNINGAEEQGLLGARGFLRHPWMRDVRAFIDLEAAGNAGRAVLFQTGPGNTWLTRAYARAAPRPDGSIVGQDIFRTGAIPSSTDFEVYAAAGIPGLDIALYRNGYAYHTALDRVGNIEPGSVQHMGANALAVVRELASRPLPSAGAGAAGTASVGDASVYYDFLGRAMLAYGESTARHLALAAALAALLAVAAVLLRGRARLPGLVLGFAAAASAAVLAPALAIGAGAIPYYVFGRPHGWYAHPALAVVAHGGAAVTAMLAVHALANRLARRLRAGNAAFTIEVWAGTLLLLTALMLVLASASIGSGYLLLWWVAPGALALLLLAFTRARTPGWIAIAAFIPGLLLTGHFAFRLLALFVPIAGRMPLAVSFDLPIAAMVGGCAVLLLSLPLALVHSTNGRGRATLVATLVAATLCVMGLIAVTLAFPYTPRRPQRITIWHEQTGDSARLIVEGQDFLGAAVVARVAPSLERFDPVEGRPRAIAIDAAATGYDAPGLQVIAERAQAGAADRVVELRLARDDTHLHGLAVPRARLAGWQVGSSPLPLPDARRAEAVLSFVSAPETGWRLTLHIRGDAPLPVRVTSIRSARTVEARRVLAELPPWATVNVLAVNRRTFSF
ncbi:MAG: M28 family peptidase, partial [Gemmatimonadaceae bacterium]